MHWPSAEDCLHGLDLSFYRGVLGVDLRSSGLVVSLPAEPPGQPSLFTVTVCVPCVSDMHVLQCTCGGQNWTLYGRAVF